MSTGKRNRRRGQNENKQPPAQTRLTEGNPQPTENKPLPSAQDEKQQSASLDRATEESRKKVVTFWSRSSPTDWIIAAFTVVLACTSIYQFIVMRRQLDTMQNDQRPWLKVSLSSYLSGPENQPMGGVVHLTNNGKTPARAVSANFVVEKVKNGDQPRMDYSDAHLTFTTGMITPNDVPVDIQVRRLHPDLAEDPLTPSELDDFNHIKIFFVLYGTVTYNDFVGTKHFTKFCNVLFTPKPPPTYTFSGQKCTNHADVDNN